MGDSLRSIRDWIGVITFLAIIVAGANTRVQSSFIWLCLGLWFAIVVLYLLMKLTQAIIKNVGSSQTGTYRKGPSLLQWRDKKKQYLKNSRVKGSISRRLQPLESKQAGFKFPFLAGFYPQRLQGSTHKKPPQQQASEDFDLPRLAGFAPRQPQEPTHKKPPQQQASEDFDLPRMAGFTPGQSQEPTNKKTGMEAFSSQDYIPPGLPPELFLQ